MASESVLSSLTPIGLNELSRRLGVDPFETVRLLVAVRHDLSGPMMFDPSLVETLRSQGGVEDSWWADAGAAEPKERVQAVVRAMLDRGLVGDTTTRMDNVWRGLPFEDQALVQQAITALAEEQIVRCIGTPIGLQVAIDAGQKAKAEKIAAGKASTSGLDALYEG
jgi:hypothetical protein